MNVFRQLVLKINYAALVHLQESDRRGHHEYKKVSNEREAVEADCVTMNCGHNLEEAPRCNKLTLFWEVFY